MSKKNASDNQASSSRDPGQPTTSKRAMEDDTTKHANKRKSQTKLQTGGEEKNVPLTKRQQTLEEMAQQKNIILHESRRPLFFKPKFKVPESMAHHILRRVLKSTDEHSSSWGLLEFYEGSRLISTFDLSGDAPILVNSKLLLSLSGKQETITDYTDWEHALCNSRFNFPILNS
jgi:hypothetical protein